MVLDEKCFRRIERFDRDLQKFRGWLFEVLVAIGQVDAALAKELEKMVTLDIGEANPER